ncbi:hypothetical protein ACFL0V_06720 [Nanoarchaeota archaeon]
MCCTKCGKGMAAVLLLLGILFILRDLGVWNFFNIQWWTALFLVAGFAMLGMHCCPECREMCETKHGKKKK